MAETSQKAYNEILAHIQKQGGSFSSWYCGITENIKDRLFGDHNVPEKGHWYAYRQCINSYAARSVENTLLDHGCDGGSGGGDADADYVYAYLKTSVTDP